MAADNAETALARTLNGRYARAGGEACALTREALAASGDIIPSGRISRPLSDTRPSPLAIQARKASA